MLATPGMHLNWISRRGIPGFMMLKMVEQMISGNDDQRWMRDKKEE
jgi:hypothetical protein